MTSTRPGDAPAGLHQLIARLDLGRLADGELLARYLGRGDEAAFGELVRRHGPLVYGVCRRRLGPGPDADDAFQAAFIVLHRKAAGLADRRSLASWLFGVADRVSRKGRVTAARRRAKEAAAARPEAAPEPWEPDEAVDRLAAAVARLPARYREVVVLCELEGRPRKDVAAALGIPEGTLASRLAYARRRLADRLTRAGVVAVPVSASLMASATSAAGAGEGPAARLAAEGVSAMMRVTFGVGVGLGVLFMTAGGFGLTADRKSPDRPPPPPATAAAAAPARPPAWQAEFQRVYGLRAGQVLKRVGPPYPAARAKLFDPNEPERVDAPGRSHDEAALCYRFDGTRTTYWGLMGQAKGNYKTSLDAILVWALGFPSQAIEADPGVLGESVEGEFVLRTGASPAEWVPELERILRDECKMPVRLGLREVTRDAVVASGRPTRLPPKAGDETQVRLDPGQVTWGRGSGGGGTLATFLTAFGAHLNRHVVSDVAPHPAVELRWSFRIDPPVTPPPPADRARALDADLRAVEAQTGLTFRVEARRVRVLEVTWDAPADQ